MFWHVFHHLIHGRLIRHQCLLTRLAPYVPTISAVLCADPDGCRLIPTLILLGLTRLRGLGASLLQGRRTAPGQ